MDLYSFLILQFFAHIVADYFLQTDALAEKKNRLGFKSSYLVKHTFVVFCVSWLFSLQLKFFIGAGVIAILHYFIDGVKAKFTNHKTFKNRLFFIDQLLHIIVLILVSWLFYKYHGFNYSFSIPLSAKQIAIIVAYLCCLKPANIVIREIFKSAQIDAAIATMNSSEVANNAIKELPNAGKLIGILERLLTLTFILIGQFQAVGFLLAAKSVLRYKDTETLKTEYVLIGTMLSFGIAIFLGILTTLL